MRILLLVGTGVLLALAAAAQEPPALWLDKTSFTAGESIKVRFRAPKDFAADAWVGIVPSNVPHGEESLNDQHDTTYQYLNQRTSGEMVFKAPAKPGAYDLRMHDTDADGKEVAWVSFFVAAQETGFPPELKLDKAAFKPGEKIEVRFKASSLFESNAWVGVIPSQVPHGSEVVNDQHDLVYQYLENRTSGTLVFNAPAQAGAYDLRMHDTDNNGREVASVSFRVVKP